jgi:hypothetical protein
MEKMAGGNQRWLSGKKIRYQFITRNMTGAGDERKMADIGE